MKNHERAFDIHVQVRVPRETGEGKNRLEAVGIDHGIVHPMTTFETEGTSSQGRPTSRKGPSVRCRHRAPRGCVRGSSTSRMTGSVAPIDGVTGSIYGTDTFDTDAPRHFALRSGGLRTSMYSIEATGTSSALAGNSAAVSPASEGALSAGQSSTTS